VVALGTERYRSAPLLFPLIASLAGDHRDWVGTAAG
jgi:hypothetical protein